MAKCLGCGMSLGPFDRKVKFNDGALCIECFKKQGIPGVTERISYEETKKSKLVASAESAFNNTNVSELEEYLSELRSDSENPAVYRVGNLARFDDEARVLQLADRPRYYCYKTFWRNIPYNSIVDFELLSDGTSVGQGVGATIAGGLLFGAAGAIAGNAIGKSASGPVCSSLRLKVATSDQSNPVLYLDLVKEKLSTSTSEYGYLFDSAQQILAKLQSLSSDSSQEDAPSPKALSEADEILKFKKLADAGVITAEEFEAKKKQLLGL